MIRTQEHPVGTQCLVGKTIKRQVETTRESLWQRCGWYAATVEKPPKGRRLSLDVKTE